MRLRLTLWVVAIFVVVQFTIGFLLWVQKREASIDRYEHRLTLLVRPLLLSLGATSSRQEAEAIVRDRLLSSEFSRFHLSVVDPAGLPAVSSASDPLDALAIDAEASNGVLVRRVAAAAVGAAQWSEGAAEIVAGPFLNAEGHRKVLALAVLDQSTQAEFDLVARTLIAGGLIGVAASLLSGWLIAGIAVQPLRRLSDVADKFALENIEDAIEIESESAEVEALTRELVAAREQIRDAFAAQARFLSNISHEIKTPIATLLTESQTLDRRELSQTAAEFAGVVEEEMRKLGRLVESFLMLTRVRDGGELRNVAWYPANELVMDAITDCEAMARTYGVRLEPQLADDDAGLDAEVRGEPMLLRTMLNNLIRNAVRFSPHDGAVRVRCLARDGRFQVSVADSGPGIPQEILDHLFDRFVQSSSEVRRERGHGLGLAIAKGIAELHDGDVTAANLAEGGAEFTVWIPTRGDSINPTSAAD